MAVELIPMRRMRQAGPGAKVRNGAHKWPGAAEPAERDREKVKNHNPRRASEGVQLTLYLAAHSIRTNLALIVRPGYIFAGLNADCGVEQRQNAPISLHDSR